MSLDLVHPAAPGPGSGGPMLLFKVFQTVRLNRLPVRLFQSNYKKFDWKRVMMMDRHVALIRFTGKTKIAVFMELFKLHSSILISLRSQNVICQILPHLFSFYEPPSFGFITELISTVKSDISSKHQSLETSLKTFPLKCCIPYVLIVRKYFKNLWTNWQEVIEMSLFLWSCQAAFRFC